MLSTADKVSILTADDTLIEVMMMAKLWVKVQGWTREEHSLTSIHALKGYCA